ncbi:MAG: Hsp20/alpha crystallin family protein [Myxococcota bacterium]
MILTKRPSGLLDPFALMNEFMSTPEAFFGGFTESGRGPRIHVDDRDEQIEISVDIPGLAPEHVKVEVRDDRLSVSAHRTPQTPEGYQVRRRERLAPSFERSWRLGAEIDREGIEAQFADGVLTLQLPKRAPSRRSIPVAVRSGKEEKS